jgi:hypothetical protein
MALDAAPMALSPTVSMMAAAMNTMAYSLGATNLLNFALSTGSVMKNRLPMQAARTKDMHLNCQNLKLYNKPT